MAGFELVEITTKDRLVHQGIYYRPSKPGTKALLWVHGLTSRFYSDPTLMNMTAAACEKRGHGFAAFNNRGHDYLAGAHRLDPESEKGYRYETVGSGVETFTDCIPDIDAAISFLAGQGFRQVILAGHSSGANKVCYYAGTVQDSRISGVVLAAPISDRYGIKDIDTFNSQRKRMEQKIEEGKGDEIVADAGYFPITPHRWMSLYGQGSPEDVFNYRDGKKALDIFRKITVPLCIVFAGDDEHADRPVAEIRSAFDAHAASTKYVSMVMPDTDHGFTGKQGPFVSRVVDWVGTL